MEIFAPGPSESVDIDVDDEEVTISRPRNHGQSPPFHTIIIGFINPLITSSGKSTYGTYNKFSKKTGRAARWSVLTGFIERWKKNVGNDIYPFFRLVLPDVDKERQMYGLKEKALARLIIKVLGISPESEDANAVINYRIPGQQKGAGDFAERCFEVIKKRQMRTEYGSMTINQVNDLLDELSRVSKAVDQLPIITNFYNNMNAEEMKWLIRIILRQMHIGVSERLLFSAWHPNANTLYNVSSSLKRVCWELYDNTYRLTEEEEDVTLMSCFQPQLAAFPKSSYDQIVRLMGNEVFYIEEKMDGERIQLHMSDYGNKFKFFSRRAKDYTYLYGDSLQNGSGALTKFLSNAFIPTLENCILDGEMVSWDPSEEKIEPFGSLKTAAHAEIEDKGLSHPLYLVFDVLYANSMSVVKYSLAERRRLLRSMIRAVPNHFLIHPFEEALTKDDIDKRLRQVIAESSEGLVIKSPMSTYTMNGRNDDWIKVKPEYMQEFGESLDCLIIGGYYGQGKRAQFLSSFLCGLRVDNEYDPEAIPRFWSFCRVGGGFTASEYAEIRHLTEGQWQKWDPKRPPLEFMELAGERNEKEMPDVWIRPDKSVVLEVKAGSIVPAPEQYRTNVTLRFPRFRRLRPDKDYRTALSVKEFLSLKAQVEHDSQERVLEMDTHRRRAKRQKKEITILNTNKVASLHDAEVSQIFDGHQFYLLLDSKSKIQIEQLIMTNGGQVIPSLPSELTPNIHVIANKDLVKVVSLKRQGKTNILRPVWVIDCSFNNRIVPVESRHVYFGTPRLLNWIERRTDLFGDSYTRSMESTNELQEILERMPLNLSESKQGYDVYEPLTRSTMSVDEIPSLLFYGTVLYFDFPERSPLDGLPTNTDTTFKLQLATNYARFGGAKFSDRIDDPELSHIVAMPDTTQSRAREIKTLLSKLPSVNIPRFVSANWITTSWAESSRLSEENFML
ncbi:ATP dependent DNA ligase domain-containing protein [Lipomyces arxii]|uniref:ATP dependent DNA ligase domain-containing protein n=1 Tax=Lipomyces arxii TaxID=56418 RepID=UPI0034CFC975